MNRGAERILVALLLAYVGSVIAEQLGTLWWIGLIIGFTLGYVGYDVRGFVRAIPAAFRRASTRPEPSITAKEWVTNVCHCTFYTIGAGTSMVLTMGILFAPLVARYPIMYDGSYLTFVALLAIGWTLVFYLVTSSTATNPKHRDSHIELMSILILWAHPVTFTLRTLPIFAFYALMAVAWTTEKGSEFTCRFIRHLFLLVHSHERALFGIDVAIGVAVGHYTGNAILGGLTGAVWWIFDWHLISVQWLKIEPAR